MSEQPEQPTAAAETAAPETEESAEQKKPTETVDFWKAKAREQEKRAKENATAAKELAALKDSEKTELQREREAREAAEKRAAALESARELDGWKSDISKKTGIPADVLRGTTLEELEDHAASLKPLLAEPRKPGVVPTEGRTVTTGTGDPAHQLAAILKQQLT